MTAGLVQRLEMLEDKKGKSLPKSQRGNVGHTAMETKVQEKVETTVKQLLDMKESIENSMKDVEVEEREFSGKERDQLDVCEKIPEERKKFVEESSDCNNNAVLSKTAPQEEIVVVADRGPNALKRYDILLSPEIQENASSLDKATSPVKQLESKFEGEFALPVFSEN